MQTIRPDNRNRMTRVLLPHCSAPAETLSHQGLSGSEAKRNADVRWEQFEANADKSAVACVFAFHLRGVNAAIHTSNAAPQTGQWVNRSLRQNWRSAHKNGSNPQNADTRLDSQHCEFCRCLRIRLCSYRTVAPGRCSFASMSRLMLIPFHGRMSMTYGP